LIRFCQNHLFALIVTIPKSELQNKPAISFQSKIIDLLFFLINEIGVLRGCGHSINAEKNFYFVLA